MGNIKTYTELSKIKTFEERFEYLKIGGTVGYETFGFDRVFNQQFYTSFPWIKVREKIILRDKACDLGCNGLEIRSRIVIHHINPINMEDILRRSDMLLDPEFLICTKHITHNAIHYGDKNLLVSNDLTIRTPNDTCPWKK